MTADDRSRYVLGADVGGTFTDITVFDRETRSLTTEKVLSTPEDPSSGVLDGVTAAMEMVDAELSQLQAVNHGTTIVTNMLLEETGAKTGLVVTEGYEHVLHLARAWTPGPLYGWIDFEKPDPLADLAATKGISARLDDDGEVLDPVDEADVIDAVDELLDQGVEAIAVMLLNSYVDGKQEERIREIVAEAYPDLPVSISSAGVAEYGEYERTMTAVINAYSRPQVGAYLDGLKASLQEQGWQGRLNVVRSDGGTTSVGMAKRSPVSLVLSGPSGGVVGAAHLANTLGVPDVLTLDMGGTSTDVSLVESGEPSIRREIEIGHRSFKTKTVDVNTVGAGGGSIASHQVTGALTIGPESAGADPGPACYGRGGKEPTVTDANVVLGRIPSSTRLGGALDLDRAAARDVIATLAEDRGLSVEETAQGIVDMVTQDVYSALRVVSVEKGYDPREFGLVAFGGAGPLHADAVGSRIQASPVVIPPAPGVMSAFGFLTSDVRKEFAEAYVRNSEEVDGAELHERLLALRQEAAGWLTDEEVASDSRAYDYYLECRYYRQDIQITVPVVPDELTDDDGLASIRSRFENRYENQYGFTLDSPLEFVNLRVVGHGSVQGVTLSESSPTGTDIKSARLGYEDVYFGEKYYETPVYRRRDLYPGNELDGPAVVIEDDATTVVQPDSVATVNRYGCLEIRGGA